MRNRAIHVLFLTSLLLSCARNTFAQVPTAFDNTSITPANEKVGKLLELSNDTIAGAQTTLPDLLFYEYHYRLDHIHGLTREQETTRFDVTAKIDPPGVSDPVHNPKAQAFVIDALLKNHFHMKAHEAMIDVTSEHLLVAPGGIKFNPTPPPPPRSVLCPCPRKERAPNNAPVTRNLKDERTSMSGLARQLSDESHIEVVDRTNLQGDFIVDLSWLPSLNVTPQTAEQVLRTALQTHLGLTFLPMRSQEKVIVIDYIELPASVIWLPPASDSAQTASSH